MQKMLLTCTILLSIGTAYAQDDTQGVIPVRSSSSGEATNDAVGIHLAPGVRALAAVGLETIYNSNFYLSEDNAKSSLGFVLTPNVLLQRDAGKLKYEVGLGLETTRYTDVSVGPDSYLDGSITGKINWDALTRHHFSADYYTRYSHDPFGSVRTEENVPLNEGLDKWLETGVHGTYRFGAPGALINLESAAGWTGRRYETNRDATDVLDYKQWDVRETAYFNISSRTALLAEFLHSSLSYYTEFAGFPSRDNQTTNYRVGMHWIATGTTSGDIRVGTLRRDFDDPTQAKVNAVDWSATLNWAPEVYSVFSLQTGVQSQQSYLAGVQLLQNRFGVLSWSHDFSYYLRTRVSYSHVNTEFIGSTRTDNINTFGVEANYILTPRWMTILGASYSRRDSNQAGLDYGDTSVYLGVRYGR